MTTVKFENTDEESKVTAASILGAALSDPQLYLVALQAIDNMDITGKKIQKNLLNSKYF